MDWSSFWSVVWTTVFIFAFVAYLIVLFQIVTDIFRDKSLRGWQQVLWIIALVVAPYISAFVYIIARGKGMVGRQEQARAAAAVALSPSPADQIATGKQLLDSGAINQQEFDALKSHALQGVPAAPPAA